MSYTDGPPWTYQNGEWVPGGTPTGWHGAGTGFEGVGRSAAEGAAIIGAINGYQVYQATGDSRLAARTGAKSAALNFILILVGVVCFFALLSFLGAVFFTYGEGVDLNGAFVSLVVASLAVGLVMMLYRTHKVMMNKAVNNQGQVPTIPGEALPPMAPRPNLPQPTPGQQQYTYDLRTGRFIKHW